MTLKFPNARLMVFSKLAPGEDCCVQAIVQTAAELGIIKSDALNGLNVSDTTGCGSLFAGREVVGQFCRERFVDGKINPGVMCDQLWQKIEKDIEEHRQEKAIVHERSGKLTPIPIDCALLAPVVVDFMLQHLTPYL
jgi:hypothetical protein